MTDPAEPLFFGGRPVGWRIEDEPLDPDLLVELDDEMLATTIIDASVDDRQALWAEIERRGLCR